MSRHMNISEFAREMNISRMTVHRWMKRGMPHIKMDNFVRINVDEALKWMKEQN